MGFVGKLTSASWWSVPTVVTLSLPYSNEKNANNIRNYMKSNKLLIRPIFTPGRTLAKTFCSSISFDRKECVE